MTLPKRKHICYSKDYKKQCLEKLQRNRRSTTI